MFGIMHKTSNWQPIDLLKSQFKFGEWLIWCSMENPNIWTEWGSNFHKFWIWGSTFDEYLSWLLIEMAAFYPKFFTTNNYSKYFPCLNRAFVEKKSLRIAVWFKQSSSTRTVFWGWTVSPRKSSRSRKKGKVKNAQG